MNLQKNNISKIPLNLIITVLILSFILFYPTFKFALAGGEDWLTLYRYIKTFDSFTSHFDLGNYIGNYDAGNIFMGIIYRMFGFNPLPYYIASLIFRIFASLTLYLAVLRWTEDKFAAWIASVIFIAGFAGIQATEYSFNMTTYASLGFFNIFMYLFAQSRENLPTREILKEVFLLFVAFYIAPHRLHGLIITIPFVEFLRIKKKSVNNLFSAFLRIVLLLAPIFVFRISTALSLDEYSLNMLREVLHKHISIFFYPISIMGSTFFPDRIVSYLLDTAIPLSGKSFLEFLKFFFPILLSFLIMSYLLFRKNVNQKYILVCLTAFYFAFCLLLFFCLNQPDSPNLQNPITVAETLIGSFALTLMTSFFILNARKHKKLVQAGLFGLTSAILLNTIPWLARYTATFPSDHRYLVMPSASFLVAFSCFLAILIIQKRHIFAFLIFIFILLVNIFSIRGYFNYHSANGRNSKEVDKYFDQIRSVLPEKLNDGLVVFLFTSDDAPMTLYHAITFGFSNHLVLIDQRFAGYDSTKVLAVDNKKSLLEIYKDPNSHEFYRYGMPYSKISVENIYSFELKNKNLIDNTWSLRDELLKVSRDF